MVAGPEGRRLSECSSTSEGYVIVAFCLATFGQLLLSTGLLLLKRAAIAEADKPFYRRGLFWGGILLLGTNSIVIDAL